MSKNRNDWWCPTCQFTIWGSKPKCLKCGSLKPSEVPVKKEEIKTENKIEKKIDYWTPESDDPKWNKYGPYSYLKGGYYGDRLPDEPENLIYPKCGCNHLENCPRRHHPGGCKCYTCRGKTHKW